MGLLDNIRETYSSAKWSLTKPDDALSKRWGKAFDRVESTLEAAEGLSAIMYYATDRAAAVEPYFEWFRDLCAAWDAVDDGAVMERDSLVRQLEGLADEVEAKFRAPDGTAKTPTTELAGKAAQVATTAGLGLGAVLVVALAVVLVVGLRR